MGVQPWQGCLRSSSRAEARQTGGPPDAPQRHRDRQSVNGRTLDVTARGQAEDQRDGTHHRWAAVVVIQDNASTSTIRPFWPIRIHRTRALRDLPSIVQMPGLGWLVRITLGLGVLHDRRLASGPLNTALYAELPIAARAEVEPFR